MTPRGAALRAAEYSLRRGRGRAVRACGPRNTPCFVGDHSRGRRRAVRACGPRRFPLNASLNYKGDIFYLFFRLQIHVFHTSPTFPFPNRSQLLFFRYDPFPIYVLHFTFYILRFHVFTFSSFHDRHTFIYYSVSFNKRQLTLKILLAL